MNLRSNQLKPLVNTREDFKSVVTFKDYAHAMHLKDCILHFIRYGEADKAYKTARELAHIFLPFLNRPYLKLSKKECLP